MLTERVDAMERELSVMKEELRSLMSTPHSAIADPASGPMSTVTRASSAREKIALFADYFSGRPDVYAHYWESDRTRKKGWSPTASSGFYRTSTPASDLAPFTPEVIDRHLRRGKPFHAGLYPLLTDDTCRLLVCDFDDGTWRQDAAAYARSCRSHGLDPLCEISRSDEGGTCLVVLLRTGPGYPCKKHRAPTTPGGDGIPAGNEFQQLRPVLPCSGFTPGQVFRHGTVR